MPKRYVAQLTDDQRERPDRWEAGPLTGRQRNRAQILLRADAGEADEEIVTGLAASIRERPRPGARPLLDGKAKAIVIATACSPVPEGRAVWTARMIADRLVELQVVESVSEDAVLRVLKKVNSSRGRRSRGASPRA